MTKTMLFQALFAVLLTVLLVAGPSQAQEHLSYCKGVTNTSDALACINRHREDAQIRLNMVFVDLAKSLQADKAAQSQLHEAQNAWLLYRDDQCAFEGKRAGAAALERIYELSCITNLTEQRAELLAMALYHGAKSQPREFGTFPRWMNVLAHEYPEVFWRYGSRLEVDFDCDGQDEEVMPGIAFSPVDPANSAAETGAVVVAVSSNPLTGRPQTRLFRFPLGKGKSEGRFCEPAVTMTAIVHKGQAETAEKCRPTLTISDKCYQTTIEWTGTDFTVQAMPGEAKQENQTN